MADPIRGIGYDAGVPYEKSFDSNPYFTEQTARRDSGRSGMSSAATDTEADLRESDT